MLLLTALLVLSLQPSSNCFTSFWQSNETCKINEHDIYNLYFLHTTEAATVKIKVISSFQNSEFNNFLGTFLKIIYDHDKSAAFTVEAHYIDSLEVPNRKALEIVAGIGKRKRFHLKSLYIKRFRNSRRYSGNPEEAIVVIAWEEEAIQAMFEGNPRATYLVIMASCGCVDKAFGDILRDLWLKHNVLNAAIFATCATHEHRVFIYNPFSNKMLTFTVDDVLKRPANTFNSLRNFNGYVIKTSFFLRKPSAMLVSRLPKSIRENPIYEALGHISYFGGFDGYLLANAAKFLNFRIESSLVPDEYRYGSLDKNGEYTGSLGDVVYKKVDISGNGRFLQIYEAAKWIEFTNPVSSDLVCFVVPKAQQIPDWVKMFRCFRMETWALLIIVWTLCIVLWYYMRKMKEGDKSSSAILEIISIFLTAPVDFPHHTSQRIFLASCMAFTVIITSIFQGSLVKSFSTVSYYADVNTLNELDQSGLHIATSLHIFHYHDSELMNRLESKIIFINTSALERAATLRDVVAVERQEDAKLLINTEFMRSDGYPLLHLMNECPFSLYISFIVPRGSPFLPRFNYVITQFSEGGLLSKWHVDIFDAIVQEAVKKRYVVNRQMPFDFEDVQVAFYMLGIGMVVSLVIFTFEILHNKQ